jgi:hypothetical protein
MPLLSWVAATKKFFQDMLGEDGPIETIYFSIFSVETFIPTNIGPLFWTLPELFEQTRKLASFTTFKVIVKDDVSETLY